jgi:Glycosyltransferase family 87
VGIGRTAIVPGAVLAIVFLSRLPFLDAGYGIDPDAWRVAGVGREIAQHGDYVASRLPGYPLHEYGAALLHDGGPVALNGATAAFSALAALFLFLIVRALGHGDRIAAVIALTFASTPVVFVFSTQTLDYLWSLAFILGAVCFALRDRPAVAGLCLGMAIGARLTAGAMLLPVALLVVQRAEPERRVRDVAWLAGPALLVGGAWFAPVVAHYGSGFLHFYETGYPTWLQVWNRATSEVWGHQGWLALVIAVLISVVQLFRKRRRISREAWKAPEIVWLVAVALFVVAYLRLPHESGYLIPIVPFVILLLHRALPRVGFVAFCGVVALSSFVEIKSSRLRDGAVLASQRRRDARQQRLAAGIDRARDLDQPSVVVAGAWLPQFRITLGAERVNKAVFVHLLDQKRLDDYLARGYRLYYMPDQRPANERVHGIDLQRYGEPLI